MFGVTRDKSLTHQGYKVEPRYHERQLLEHLPPWGSQQVLGRYYNILSTLKTAFPFICRMRVVLHFFHFKIQLCPHPMFPQSDKFPLLFSLYEFLQCIVFPFLCSYYYNVCCRAVLNVLQQGIPTFFLVKSSSNSS